MKYRDFIQEYFLIDNPEIGKLVPFKFRPIQNKYYDILCEKYDIEKMGINAAIREDILKARKEGFTSLVLGLFAADDILSRHATESEVISYKDDATKQFRKRYKNFILSYFGKRWKLTNPRQVFSVYKEDKGEFVLVHNGAHFYCGTASARTSERGATLHKLLFSEHAHYPDTANMMAKDMVIGTAAEVNIDSGWIFKESTANGIGNFHHDEWWKAYRGESRYGGRFFGWREFYDEEQFKTISSQTTDKSMLRQEYPETPEEAFIASGTPYFDNERIFDLIKTKTRNPFFTGTLELKNGVFGLIKQSNGFLKIWEKPNPYSYYVIGGDVAEGIEGGDWSILKVIDNSTMRTVAKWKARVDPSDMAKEAFVLGMYYNGAYMGIEVNKDGLWVNSELVKMKYPNLHFQEVIDEITNRPRKKYGWKTDPKTRPVMLAELQKLLSKYADIWADKEFLNECLNFIRNKMGRPEAISGKNDDDVIATAICFAIRHNAPAYVQDPPRKSKSRKEEILEAVEKDIKKFSDNENEDEKCWRE